MLLFRRNHCSNDAIAREIRILHEIELALSNEFFKDVKRKLRRKSRRPTLALAERFKSLSSSSKTPPVTPETPDLKVKHEFPSSHKSRRHSSIDKSNSPVPYDGDLYSRRFSEPVDESVVEESFTLKDSSLSSVEDGVTFEEEVDGEVSHIVYDAATEKSRLVM